MVGADVLEQVAGTSIYPLVLPEYRLKFKALSARVFKGEAGESSNSNSRD